MAWTTSHTFTASEVVSAATMNATLRDNTTILYTPPSAAFTTQHANSLGDWQASSGTSPTVFLTGSVVVGPVELWDTDTMYDPTTPSTIWQRITVKTAGVYIIHAQIRWQPNATGVRRRVAIFWNGNEHAAQLCQNVTAIPIEQCVTATIKAAATDFFELGGNQDSGAALFFSPVTSDGTHPLMSATWVSAG